MCNILSLKHNTGERERERSELLAIDNNELQRQGGVNTHDIPLSCYTVPIQMFVHPITFSGQHVLYIIP